MSFVQAIQVGFAKYAEFRGRASRPEFWWWILFTVLVSAALSAIPVYGFDFDTGRFTAQPALTGLWSIVILLPTLAVTVRRLRDADHPWGNVFWVLLPVAGMIVLIVLCAQESRAAVPTAGRDADSVAHRPVL
ncbi:DUF805 domain-containing protein [Microbacterium sp. BK668]|uniref:DUF805 domain-containing protein n=1 Tax=Microbacterium sp. BK668 TaxID=2512118 RepID=UPI00105F5BE1|nr:DUF805 domain-containing protein [Microbacterium sp. BK668]TDN91602.1 uncharacterized membrane protein YhaH (DUF805 family) [Microbacterium sp. BK668]